MGALAHYLEAEGIPTTQISLIREHTEIIRPPRALWVPFELGRPLGVPEDPAFQRRVLRAVLDLLDASEGPVLAEFPEEAPKAGSDPDQALVGWACPVSFASPSGVETDQEKLQAAFKREVAELRPWYEMGFRSRGQEFSLAVALRLAAQDLKAFYFEAATARPGSVMPGSGEFNGWFFRETAAGRVLHTVKERCLSEGDKALRMTGAMLLIPLGQAQVE